MIELIIFLPVVVCLLAGGYYFWQDYQDRSARRYRALTRYRPDPLGNYPAFYDPASDRSLRFRPGNKAFPDLQPPSTPRPALDRPLVIRNYQTPELPRTATEPAPSDVQNRSEPDYVALLTDAKEKGIAPSRAIPAITGCSKGGGKAYKTWCEIWETL